MRLETLFLYKSLKLSRNKESKQVFHSINSPQQHNCGLIKFTVRTFNAEFFEIHHKFRHQSFNINHIKMPPHSTNPSQTQIHLSPQHLSSLQLCKFISNLYHLSCENFPQTKNPLKLHLS
jgi:hypothetical protein